MTKMFEGYWHKKWSPCNVQFFIENNNYYSYDPGFRLQGEAMHIHIDAINGFDHRIMLINLCA